MADITSRSADGGDILSKHCSFVGGGEAVGRVMALFGFEASKAEIIVRTVLACYQSTLGKD